MKVHSLRQLVPACALALALACSEPPAPSRAARGTSAEPPAPATRLTAAPVPDDLGGLDPAAEELVRRTAAEVNAASERPAPWKQLGMVYHAHRRFELARTCYEQSLLRDEQAPRTWYCLALVEEELGETERALAHLERCTSIEPAYPPAHWRTGLLRLGLGELDPAQTALEAALAIAPHDAAAVVGLARVELQRGEHAPAIDRLEEHVERVPRDANARFLLGTAYRQAGRMEDAARALGGAAGAEPIRDDPWQAEVLALRQGYRTDFLRAVDLLEQGQIERAIALLEDLHERQGDDTLIHVSLHRAYRMNGELDRAIELLREASRIDPLQDVVHLHLAGAYRDKARQATGSQAVSLLATALESIRRACELSPTYAAAHGLRGDVLLDLQQPAAAIDAYLLAARLDHNAPMWHEKAGEALCKAGRWAEAVPLLTRLDVLQPRSPRTLFLLGAALANAGRLEEARVPLEQARLLAPDDPAIRTALANVEKSQPPVEPIPDGQSPR